MDPVVLLSKSYDGESIVDVSRDVHEAFFSDFTPAMATIPQDEHGFSRGTFRVTVEWSEEEKTTRAWRVIPFAQMSRSQLMTLRGHIAEELLKIEAGERPPEGSI